MQIKPIIFSNESFAFGFVLKQRHKIAPKWRSARVIVVVQYTIYVNNLYRCTKFEHVFIKSNNFGGREPSSNTNDYKSKKKEKKNHLL